MNKLNLSIIASTIIATNSYAVSATTVDEVFSKGKLSGELSAYMTSANNEGAKSNSGYSLTSISLNYETASYNGFKANLGFISNQDVTAKNNTDFNGSPDAAMNVANINYTTDDLTLIIGKQPINLEWITDFHDAQIAVYKGLKNTTILLGHTQKKTDNGNDSALSEFGSFNGSNGANVLDVTYVLNDTTQVNGYYMDAPDLFSAVGAKVETDVSGLGISAKVAASSEDVVNTKDGNIIALDLNYKFDNLSVNGGYISTGKNNGIGSLSTIGDNISPLDSGNHVYSIDATTTYIKFSTTASEFDIGLIYGTTSYGNNTESEFNFNVEKELTKNTKLNLLYSTIDAEAKIDDKSYYSVQLAYSF